MMINLPDYTLHKSPKLGFSDTSPDLNMERCTVFYAAETAARSLPPKMSRVGMGCFEAIPWYCCSDPSVNYLLWCQNISNKT